MYAARLVIAYFHSTSGGRTASVEDVWVGSKRTPYLTGVADPYDSISPHHTWGPVVMPAGRLQRLLKAPGRLLDVRTTTNASARADTLIGLGTGGEGSAARAGDVRRELGLRSTWFRVGVLPLRSPRSRTCSEGRRGSRAPRAVSMASAWSTWDPRAGARSRRRSPPATDSFSVAVRPTATAQYRLSLGGAKTGVIRLGVAPQVSGFRRSPTRWSFVAPCGPGSSEQRLRSSDKPGRLHPRLPRAGRAAFMMRPGTRRFAAHSRWNGKIPIPFNVRLYQDLLTRNDPGPLMAGIDLVKVMRLSAGVLERWCGIVRPPCPRIPCLRSSLCLRPSAFLLPLRNAVESPGIQLLGRSSSFPIRLATVAACIR